MAAIPCNLITSLSETAQVAFREIDLMVDFYLKRNNTEIGVRDKEWDAINKSLKKHKYNLVEDTYRGMKLKRITIAKRKRYKAKDIESFI